MANIRIKDLTRDASPKQDDIVPIDLAGTRGTQIKSLVEAGRPTASKEEAEVGTDAHKAMTPLTTKQAIDAQVGAAYVAKTVSVNAGGGLAGGGNLSGDVTVSLNQTNINRLNKVDGIQAGAQVNTVNSVAGKTGDVILNKNDVGLGNIDNTSDINKPISNDMQTALNNKVSSIMEGDFIEVDSTSVTNPVVSLSEHAQQVITDNSLARHTHSNKNILDRTNEPFTISLKEKIEKSIQAPGGITGQVLTKASDADGNVIWSSIEAATAVSYAPQTLTAEQQTQARANIDAIAKSGDYLEGLLTAWAGGDDRIMLPGQGEYPSVAINYSAAGNVGFYDRDNFRWLMRVDKNGVLRDVQIPSGLIQENPTLRGIEVGMVFEQGALRFTSNPAANFLQTGSSLSASFRPLYISAVSSATPIVAVQQDRVEVPRLRISATDDLSPTSVNHGFQIGPNNGLNLGIDNNEIIVRNNGAINNLGLNETFNINDTQVSVVSGRNVNFRNAGWVDVPTPTGANQAATKAYVDSRPTWPGVYTGTARDNTNFPVGSYVSGGFGGTGTNRNQSLEVRLSTGSSTWTYEVGGSGALLSGVWRQRGTNIAQRVS